MIGLHHGDCMEILPGFEDDSVDSIVTDPPYGLGFMGKAWDALPPGEEWARECLRVLKPGGYLLAFGGTRTWHRLAVAVEDSGFEIRDSVAWMYGNGFPKHRASLKPAFEPIVMARKPFKGSLTANEAMHGTGALDIEGCRVGSGERRMCGTSELDGNILGFGSRTETRTEAGRWPANVILDADMAILLDEQSGIRDRSTSTAGLATARKVGTSTDIRGTRSTVEYGDKGGASRFFYVAKAPKQERPAVGGVTHPTVKPLSLMRHLVRLVTPKGGTVLDPFAGSGTTVEACLLEGFDCVAIEREAEYLPLIQHRIERTS